MEKANGTLAKVDGMDDKLNDVQRMFTDNKENVKQAGDFANMAKDEADGAEQVRMFADLGYFIVLELRVDDTTRWSQSWYVKRLHCSQLLKKSRSFDDCNFDCTPCFTALHTPGRNWMLRQLPVAGTIVMNGFVLYVSSTFSAIS